jgi:hypothetical protein
VPEIPNATCGPHGMPGHAVLPLAMTRKQVADRLGRSLATVRRLEGTLLHPHRDVRGVHHFDREEVEALARDLDAGSVSLRREQALPIDDGESRRADDAECARCTGLQEQVDTLNAELEAIRRSHRREVESLETDSARTQNRLRGELADLEREVADFVATVEGTLR